MTSARKTVGWAIVVLLAGTALATADTAMPLPGMVNYVEGQVTLDGENLSASSAGRATVGTNQVLDIAQGRVELLLTPGVFLRVGNNSELRMVSTEAPGVAFELVKGGAILEADQLSKGAGLSVLMDGSTTHFAKPGLYAFGATERGMGALAGEATVDFGNAHLTLKQGHGVYLLPGQPLKALTVNMAGMENEPLYIWSQTRSLYQAQANIEAAQAVLAGGGIYDAGWYWDDPWDCFAFLPASGIVYGPFGWGFSAPGVVAKVPHPIAYPVPIVHPPKWKALLTSASHSTGGHAASGTSARSGGGSGGGHASGGGSGGGHVGGGGGGGGGGRR